MKDYMVEQLTDSKIKIFLGNSIDLMVNVAVNSLVEVIKANMGVLNIITSYSSLYIHFKEPVDMIYLKKIIENCGSTKREDVMEKEILVTEIPVCYDDEFALDKKEAELITGLDFLEIVNLHVSRVYYIYFLGFLPGFPYLGGLDKRIHMPRKSQPRQLVKAGSVGIGGTQTGIYPLDSPGGWQIIGRTPLKLFDKNRGEPFLFASGQGVMFVSIDKKGYETIKKGEFTPKRYPVKIKDIDYDRST
ncbi:MAG: 5-oxoprolinase subunit PxpB [Calditerrivibrio sp.]|nr:5-oxoprolinase subunit PxpB [Calditerrivibrio sp.]